MRQMQEASKHILQERCILQQLLVLREERHVRLEKMNKIEENEQTVNSSLKFVYSVEYG